VLSTHTGQQQQSYPRFFIDACMLSKQQLFLGCFAGAAVAAAALYEHFDCIDHAMQALFIPVDCFSRLLPEDGGSGIACRGGGGWMSSWVFWQGCGSGEAGVL